MTQMNMIEYMKQLRKYSAPLSIERHIDLAATVLEENYAALERLIMRSHGKEFDVRILRATCYQMKVGTATAMYGLGKIDKNELLNSLDDLHDYIKSVAGESVEIEQALNLMIKKVSQGINSLIEGREQIVAFEKELAEKLDRGEDPNELVLASGIELSAGAMNLLRALTQGGSEYKSEN